MKKKIYLIPFSEDNLENKIFLPYKIPSANVPPFGYLKEYLDDKGYSLNTIDFWNPSKRTNDEIVMVFDHPPVGIYKLVYRLRKLFSRKGYFEIKNDNLESLLSQFSKKILFQFEPPVVAPWVFKHSQKIAKSYNKFFSIGRTDNFSHFYYPQQFSALFEEQFRKRNRKFLVLMNSNLNPKGYFRKELYTERLRAVKFFSARGEVDLYGVGWDKPLAPWYRSYKEAVGKSYRGFAEDKVGTVSKYTFAICYENIAWPGYISEKIFDCFFAGTIPVYWGAPDVALDIPKECFIDRTAFTTYEDLRSFLRGLSEKEIEGYRQAIRAYVSSPQFRVFTKEHFAETVYKALTES